MAYVAAQATFTASQGPINVVFPTPIGAFMLFAGGPILSAGASAPPRVWCDVPVPAGATTSVNIISSDAFTGTVALLVVDVTYGSTVQLNPVPSAVLADFTSGLPAGATQARTGNDIYVRTGAATDHAVVAGAGSLFENPGDGTQGVWTFGPFTNSVANPLDVGGTSWTNQSATRVANAQAGPDGAVNAASITDASGAAKVGYYQQPNLTGLVLVSFWVKDSLVDPPTGAGSVLIVANSVAIANSAGGWRRLNGWDTGIGTSFFAFYPADVATTGTRYVTRAQTLVSGADVPFCNGATGAATLQPLADPTQILSGGSLL